MTDPGTDPSTDPGTDPGTNLGAPHVFDLRVYYEDTDLAGVVYYANYLRYTERARTEWVRALGIDQRRMKEDRGLVFAVRRVEAEYLRPARHDDLVRVETRAVALTGARLHLSQDVLRGEELLFTSRVVLVCLTDQGAPARLPADLRALVAAGVA